MNFEDRNQRPFKKQRCFESLSSRCENEDNLTESTEPEPTTILDKGLVEVDATNRSENIQVGEYNVNEVDKLYKGRTNNQQSIDLNSVLDGDTLRRLCGHDLSQSVISKISRLSGGDLQAAVNIYWDEFSHKNVSKFFRPSEGREDIGNSKCNNRQTTVKLEQPAVKMRYLGAFGAEGWATCRGRGILKHGDKISVERHQFSKGKLKHRNARGNGSSVRQQDIIVRFTNSKSEEIGRLGNDTAQWIATLLDQKICYIDGICIYASEQLTPGETILLQLCCYILNSAFKNQLGNSTKSLQPKLTTTMSTNESQDEQTLKFRQKALSKLFEQLTIKSVKNNSINVGGKQMESKGNLIQALDWEPKHKGCNQPDQRNAIGEEEEEIEEGAIIEEEQLESLYKKAEKFDLNIPEAEAKDTFVLELRNYQKQALHWMIGKETNDETESNSAEADRRSIDPLWEVYEWPQLDHNGEKLPQNEQAEFYVNLYSGEISMEFPVQEQYCRGGILADEMGLGKTIEMLSLIHTHEYNGSNENWKSETIKAPWTTLIIAPMSLLTQWQNEAEKASRPGTVDVIVYYGPDKNIDLAVVCGNDGTMNKKKKVILITSFGVVLSEYGQFLDTSIRKRGLYSFEYFRVVIDEGHFIKNRQSKTAKACYEIKGLHRWVLTGTPIVNRLEDLYSLIKFLRVQPWCNFLFWKTFITVPFESKEYFKALEVVQSILEPLVLRRTKDMKMADGKRLVNLPKKTVIIERVEFSRAEREVYDYLYLCIKNSFKQKEEAGMVNESVTTLFAQILRLRQACCHPSLTRNKRVVEEEIEAGIRQDLAKGFADDMDLSVLIDRMLGGDELDVNGKFGVQVLRKIESEAEAECPICTEEPMVEQTVTSCWHSACKKCLMGYIEHERQSGKSVRCFNCRKRLDQRDIFQVVKHSSNDTEAQKASISLRRIGSVTSAKIERLMETLMRIRIGESGKQDGVKSVIFSQFTAFLDLIEPCLARDKFRFVRFDGSMNQKRRSVAIQEFTHSRGEMVLLLSLKAGGVGLNLTCATRVYMMDPWWSFAVESQAIDRVHRMGQEKEVIITRFIVKDSIEEKILKIQEKKHLIASTLGMTGKWDRREESLEYIRELLS